MSKPSIYRPGNLREVVIDGKRIGPSTEELAKYVPLDYIMKWFDTRIADRPGGNPKQASQGPEDMILVVESKTGSGKSTALPPEFFHLYFERQKKNIAVTQPRVLTAVEIPSQQIPPFHTKEALKQAGYANRTPLKLGENIGFQTGVIAKRPVKGLVYMTIGVLMQQFCIMSDEDICNKYGLIVIDEAHERSLGLDLTLYMIKGFSKRVAKFKERPFVIIMSATLDVKKFIDYMLDEVDAKIRYNNIFSVAGLSYPIQENFLKVSASNYVEEAARIAFQIHRNNPQDHLTGKELEKAKEVLKQSLKDGDPELEPAPLTLHPDGEKMTKFRDILIFTDGASTIRGIKKALTKLLQTNYCREYPFMILELTSDVVQSQTTDYRNLFADITKLKTPVQNKGSGMQMKQPARRIILSTNVAETGVTIDTLKYQIDTGFVKSNEFNPNWNLQMLINRPITESMYMQRRGRVGRKAPGNSYTVYTQDVKATLQKMQFPDIQKDQVAGDILNVLIREHDKTNTLLSKPLVEGFKDPMWVGDSLAGESVNLHELDLLDLPSADGLHRAAGTLYELGYIDRYMHPTKLGVLANRFRFVNVMVIKMLLSGYAYGAPMPDLITIAACMQSGYKNVFNKCDPYNPDFLSWLDEKTPEQARRRAQMLLCDETIQALILVNHIENLLLDSPDIEVESQVDDEIDEPEKEVEPKETDKEVEIDNTPINEPESEPETDTVVGGAESVLMTFCERYDLKLKSLLEVLDLRDQIINMLAVMGLNPYQNASNTFRTAMDEKESLTAYLKTMKRCIYEGFWQNMLLKTPTGYETYDTHLKIDIGELANLAPVYVVCSSITLTGKAETLYKAGAEDGFVSVMDGYVDVDLNRAVPI